MSLDDREYVEIETSLLKRANETDIEYFKRLVDGKLVDRTLAYCDFSEIAERICGISYSSDYARKFLHGCKFVLDNICKEQDEAIRSREAQDILNEIEQKRIDLQKERVRLFDMRAAYNKIIREEARRDELKLVIERSIKEAELPRLNFKPRDNIATSDNDLLVCLSDIHYGIVVDNAWGKYSSEKCANMLNTYLERIVEIAKTHNSENCYLFGLGDYISGNIHLPIALSNRENIIEQVIGVSELIAEFIYLLSMHFKQVYVFSVAGNHSRVAKKDDAMYNERLDDLLIFYLRDRLKYIENVSVNNSEKNKIDASMFVAEIRGKNYIGVHGDWDDSVSKMQCAQMMVQKPIYAVICGHKHHSYSETVQGIRLVMSGSFVAMDDYAVSKRLYSKPEQTVCVCNDRGIVCTYNVEIGD